MATATTATPWTNSSAANFRAWGSWISSLFTTFGWVNVYQAFATGTDWTDVSAPTLTNDMEVAEIWRMDDSLQATAPLFLKIEYGSGTAVNNPGIRLTLGTGHDGSGNITGVLYAGTILSPAANANNMTHYASGDTSRISMALAIDGTGWATGGVVIINLERRKDGSGADQGTGFLHAQKMGTTTTVAVATLAGAAGPVTLTVWGVPLVFSAEANMTFDSRQAVGPLCYCLGPAEIGLGLVGVPQAAYTVGATFTVNLLGSNHTYIVIQAVQYMSPIGASASTAVRPAMRYE